MTVFLDITLCSMVEFVKRFGGAHCLHCNRPDDGGSKHLWYVGKLLQLTYYISHAHVLDQGSIASEGRVRNGGPVPADTLNTWPDWPSWQIAVYLAVRWSISVIWFLRTIRSASICAALSLTSVYSCLTPLNLFLFSSVMSFLFVFLSYLLVTILKWIKRMPSEATSSFWWRLCSMEFVNGNFLW
jgi:hypothetical protein